MLRDKRNLKKFLISVFNAEKVSLEKISYIFCKDDFQLELNKKFLNHDTYTDIITFPLSDENESMVAEIYISVERVKENAVKLENEYYEELIRVMIHGVLHLCGYSDHSHEERIEMRKKEDLYLSQWFHVKH